MKHATRSALPFLLLTAAGVAAQAPLHPPEIRTVFPLGGVQGDNVEVLVDGQNVAAATAAAVSGAGVRAEVVAAGPAGVAHIVGTSTARLRFQIAADAPPGIREFRLLTPSGVTNRALFEVSTRTASALEAEPNNTPAEAQQVPLPVTVEGRVYPAEDADQYRFTARAGDELLFQVTAKPLESRLDAVLTLRDAAGRELASNDDYVTSDSVLAHRFAKAGDYCIEVRDVAYGGSLESRYRLRVSREPFLRTAYPLGARRGTLADFNLFGLNLGQLQGRGGDWYMPDWEVPQARYQMTDAPAGPREFRIATPGGTSNALSVEALDVPELREVEPNDDAARASRLAVPGVGHGQIYGGKGSPNGDIDLFRFPAKKGRKLRLSVLARARGSLLDALLTVRDAGGKKLARADDTGRSRDPALEFDPPADGDYLAEVADLNGAGGLEFVYMLRVEPIAAPKPDFSLALYPANPSVPQGGMIPVEVRAARQGGFKGPIRFQLPPLPEGVTAFVPPYAATAERFYIALSATRQAPRVLTPFGLTGTAEIDGKPVERAATGKERVWDLKPLHAKDTTLMRLGVCEPPDFTLRLDRSEVILSPGEGTEVTVHFDKIANYPRGIPVRAATVDYQGGALPTGLSVGRVTLPPGAKAVAVRVAADRGTPPGEYPIFVCGLSNPSTNDYILVAQLAPPLKVKVVDKKAAGKK